MGLETGKKALQKFLEHEKCDMHREAVDRLAAKSSGRNVATLLNTQHEADTAFHREMLQNLLSCIQFLSRQGLPFRGHREDAESFEGNLYQLLRLQAKNFPQMKTWLRKREYISPEIINELITIMGQRVLREILTEIRRSYWFAIIADEASDLSHNEHLSLSIRWIDDTYSVQEDTLGLVQLPNTKAQTLFSVIKDILIRCSLPISQCRGQAFDGVRNGVQALVKKEQSRALYVHCLAQSLNLCVQDVTKKCVLIRNVMDFIHNLVQLIKFSPKRLYVFDSLRKDAAISSTPSLRTLCPTRWTVRHSAINSILLNYEVLLRTLETVEVGHDEYAAMAHGLHMRMESLIHTLD